MEWLPAGMVQYTSSLTGVKVEPKYTNHKIIDKLNAGTIACMERNTS